MKTYLIKCEPVNGVKKYNVYYYNEKNKLETKEFHSYDGINGTVKEGYILKSKTSKK